MPRVAPFLLAAAVTALIGVAVAMEPYFAGDVAVARLVQAIAPGPEWTAMLVPTALAPLKFLLMALTIAVAWALAGWRGAALAVAAIVIEQLGGEAVKPVFGRPRPSPELIAVAGNPSGFGFPSTFVTFYSVTFGALAVLAWRAAGSPLRTTVLIVAPLMLVVGWIVRIVPGAHWPSDVVLTTLICLIWIWAAARVASPPAFR